MATAFDLAAPETGPPLFRGGYVPTEIARQFSEQLNNLRSELAMVPAALAEVPWRIGGWTRKQIVGHLLDSATNNRQRFVRAALDGDYTGPTYGQAQWVAIHGYADQSWDTLLSWWQIEHDILRSIVDRIPSERMNTPCKVDGEPVVTLQFLIEHYIEHQYWHLEQIKSPTPEA